MIHANNTLYTDEKHGDEIYLSSWIPGETYYQRLERLGWKHTYSAPRWDTYRKRDWIVFVPATTLTEPKFRRSCL